MRTSPIRVALVGVGNCASSLVQGLNHYPTPSNDHPGLLNARIGGYGPSDIRVVAAWDVDRRKVGRDVAEAIFAAPNCTTVFQPEIEPTGAIVTMGCILDGVAEHMLHHPHDARTFRLSDAPEANRAAVIDQLRRADVDVMVNYLPVGSQEASAFYADCALGAGVAFVNSIPVFIASDPAWAKRFRDAGVPIIGDDIKAQVGATIIHRSLAELFDRRGVSLDRTYQLNTGGNTDFLNMSSHDRLRSKRISKTEAVQSALEHRLDDTSIHVGPSDYVAWQNDTKVCFLRMEGRLFGGVPMNLELRLSVEDSPNSAGIAIDMIRCAKVAAERGIGGPVEGISAFFCKHPPVQMNESAAAEALNAFIANVGNQTGHG